MSSNENNQASEQKGSGGGGLFGAIASGAATAGNVAGTAASGILSTAGDTVNTAAKGTGDTLQKTIGGVTGNQQASGEQGKGSKELK